MDSVTTKKIEQIKEKIENFHNEGAIALEATFNIELAGVYLKEHDLENANNCFKIALELDKDLSRDNKAYVYRKIAQKYYDAKYLEEAISCFKRAMDLCKTQNNIAGVCYHAYSIGKCLIESGQEDTGMFYLNMIEDLVNKHRYEMIKENKFSKFKVCLCTLRDSYLLKGNKEKAEEIDAQRKLLSSLEDDQWKVDRDEMKYD